MVENYYEEPDYKALYEIPIEQLELSAIAIQQLKEVDATSVGDCIDHFIRGEAAMISLPPGFIPIMETEVKEKLKEHGFWAFYEKYGR